MLVTDRTFSECAERVARSDDLVLDLESNGLRPWKGDRQCGVAVEPGDGGEPMYFAYRHGGGGNLSAGPERLYDALAPRAGRKYRGWFLRYDMTMLSYEDRRFLDGGPEVHDGIVAALLLNENEPTFGLEGYADKYLGRGAGGSKATMTELLKARFPDTKGKALKGRIHELPAHEVEGYALGDVTLPRRIQALHEPALATWGLTTLNREMNDYALLLARMQTRGILIDTDRCAALSAGTEDRKAAVLKEIRAEACNPKFNPNSPIQVPKLLGTPDGKKATLKLVRDENRGLAQKIIDYRKLGKAKSAYYDSILELVDANGVLHPQLNLTRDMRDQGGTRTSRLSCALPNFQALPHADEDPNAIYQVRDLVIPHPGYKLAKCDYQRAEMWMGASYSGDEALIEAYYANRDIYQEMANELHIDRQEAKILFLMLQYGAGAFKVAQFFGWPFKTVAMLERECGIEVKDWKDREWRVYKGQRAVQVRDGFFELYPAIKAAMGIYAAHFEQEGILRLWTDRVIHFDPTETPAYAAWNRVIQGAVGEMVRIAMLRLEPMLAQYDAYMILQVHDELLIEYPEKAERPVLTLVKNIMEDFDFKLRPRVDIGVSARNYATTEAWAA